MGYLYLAKNNTTGKMYVGKTTRDFNKRIAEHIRDASKGSTTPFHIALREYGPEAFTFEIVECEDSILSDAEGTLIKQNGNGYNNLCPSVSGYFVGSKIDDKDRYDTIRYLINKLDASMTNDDINEVIIFMGMEHLIQSLAKDNKHIIAYDEERWLALVAENPLLFSPPEKTLQ